MNRKTFLRYSNTPEGGIKSFSSEVMGVNLLPIQEFIASTYESFVRRDKDINMSFLCPRRSGKTVVAKMLINWEAFVRPCSTIMYVMPTAERRDLARRNFEHLASKSKIETCELQPREYMVGGSKVYIVTPRDALMCGVLPKVTDRVDLLIFDDFFMGEETKQVFQTIISTFEVGRTVILGTETPKIKFNNRIHPKWIQLPINWMMNMSYEVAMDCKDKLGEVIFNREFEPSFTDENAIQLPL